jgi:uncharacterized protein (DUF697 family)/uncharacterized tellurite resistance protein B-like protein
MNTEQQKAILTLCLMAALADGGKDAREREALERIASRLTAESGHPEAFNVQQMYQDVIFGRTSIDALAATLTDPQSQRLAYEMAVHVIDADGSQTDSERAFLSTLRGKLGLTAADAEAIAAAAIPATAVAATATTSATAPVAATQLSATDEAEMDKSILNASILNGALELLPQSWATMAIIPLQTRLVYRIGQRYGYELDSGHIKEFLATVGVGLASQYLEQAGRKLLGGLFGKLAGGLVGGLARGATGVAFSFASTYALGQLAKRYYGGGRTMSTDVLKQTFEELMAPAKELQTKYLPQIQEKARSVNMTDVMAMIKR